MIILYIPFAKDEAGDLSQAAEAWVINHRNNSIESIMVIHHQDEFRRAEILYASSLYVLAHGCDDVNMIANHIDETKGQRISISTLTDRFNQDILAIAHSIGFIHIYCCGTEQDNELRARQFQSGYLRAENSPIYFYKGTVFSPDARGMLWSFAENHFQRAENRRRTLSQAKKAEEKEVIPPKLRHLYSMFQKAKETRHKHYIARCKKHRLHFFDNKRQIQSLDDFEEPSVSASAC